MSREQIVSSTGNPGIGPRSDNRFYCNWRGRPIVYPSTIEDYFRLLSTIEQYDYPGGTILPEGRRDVFRGVVDVGVVADLVAREDVPFTVEVAFPLRDNLWYLGVARNHSSRKTLRPVEEMVRGVRENIRQFSSPRATINHVLEEGHAFITTILPEDIETQEQLFGLWEESFGWDASQISNFSQRLSTEKRENRSVWFSGIKDARGILTAAAMAELIIFQDMNGDPIYIIESTEWRSNQIDHIKAVIDQLHAQVLSDYPNGTIIAECNYHRGAHRAAQKSGMTSPDVLINGIQIPQVLVQNVQVGDGNEPKGLRDFILFVLPHGAISQQDIQEILAMTM